MGSPDPILMGLRKTSDNGYWERHKRECDEAFLNGWIVGFSFSLLFLLTLSVLPHVQIIYK